MVYEKAVTLWCFFLHLDNNPEVVIEGKEFPAANKLIFGYKEGQPGTGIIKGAGTHVDASFFFSADLPGKD